MALPLLPLVAAKIVTTAVGTLAIFTVVAVSDVANGALIAGLFTVVNTVLNGRILVRIARIESKTDSVKKIARESVEEFKDLSR